MKTVINPNYEHLRSQIVQLPHGGYKVLHTYRNRRNTVEKIELEGETYILKTFAKPTEANRVVYTFLRHTKARHGYDNALRLRAMGIDTPEPVAYMVGYRGGTVHTCYLLTLFYDYPLMDNVAQMNVETKQAVLAAFAQFTVYLHTHNIMHRDYNYGNVMYHYHDNEVRFSLIDVNRMYFGHLSRAKCINNLRFSIGNVEQTYLLEKYAELRGWNEVLSITVNYIVRLNKGFLHRIKCNVKSNLHNIRTNQGGAPKTTKKQ